MGRYDEQVADLHSQGLNDSQIAAELGVSRPTVWAAKKRKGLVRPRNIDKFTIRILPEDFVPENEHRRQHAYHMIRALEKEANGEDLNPNTKARLNSFIAGLQNRIWVYERDNGGWRHIRRRPEHGDAIILSVD